MIEVELKARINRLEVEKCLMNLNFSNIEEAEYSDTYFDFKEHGLFSLDRELRVRKIKSKNGKLKTLLTYKDSPIDSVSKSKPEYEVEVSDYKTITHIIKSLGLVVDIAFKKNCKNYSVFYKDQRITATVVTIPELGNQCFIEVETLIKNKREFNSTMSTLKTFLKKLKIPKSNITAEYYADAVRRFRDKK